MTQWVTQEGSFQILGWTNIESAKFPREFESSIKQFAKSNNTKGDLIWQLNTSLVTTAVGDCNIEFKLQAPKCSQVMDMRPKETEPYIGAATGVSYQSIDGSIHIDPVMESRAGALHTIPVTKKR
jgi:hypothetical protein